MPTIPPEFSGVYVLTGIDNAFAPAITTFTPLVKGEGVLLCPKVDVNKLYQVLDHYSLVDINFVMHTTWKLWPEPLCGRNNLYFQSFIFNAYSCLNK